MRGGVGVGNATHAKCGWMLDLAWVFRILMKYSSAQVPKALIDRGFGLDRAFLVLVDLSFECYD
jgi:hypothetical protein